MERVTSWWHAGPSTWHRYFGEFNLEAKKVGPGHYVGVVSTHRDGKVHEVPSGTMAGAKAGAERWVRDR